MPTVNNVEVEVNIKSRANPGYELNINKVGFGLFCKPDVTTDATDGDGGNKWRMVPMEIVERGTKRTYFNFYNDFKKGCMSNDRSTSRVCSGTETLHATEMCGQANAFELVSTPTFDSTSVAMVYRENKLCLTFQGNGAQAALLKCNPNDAKQAWEITALSPTDKSSLQKIVDVASCAGGVFTAIPGCVAATAMTLGAGLVACGAVSTPLPATCQAAFAGSF